MVVEGHSRMFTKVVTVLRGLSPGGPLGGPDDRRLRVGHPGSGACADGQQAQERARRVLRGGTGVVSRCARPPSCHRVRRLVGDRGGAGRGARRGGGRGAHPCRLGPGHKKWTESVIIGVPEFDKSGRNRGVYLISTWRFQKKVIGSNRGDPAFGPAACSRRRPWRRRLRRAAWAACGAFARLTRLAGLPAHVRPAHVDGTCGLWSPRRGRCPAAQAEHIFEHARPNGYLKYQLARAVTEPFGTVTLYWGATADLLALPITNSRTPRKA